MCFLLPSQRYFISISVHKQDRKVTIKTITFCLEETIRHLKKLYIWEYNDHEARIIFINTSEEKKRRDMHRGERISRASDIGGQAVGQIDSLFSARLVSIAVLLGISSLSTYTWKEMVDGHHLRPIESPWCKEVNSVEPGVLGRVCLHATVTTSESVHPEEWSVEDLHNPVLILAKDSTTGVLHICPIPVVELHNITDD